MTYCRCRFFISVLLRFYFFFRIVNRPDGLKVSCVKNVAQLITYLHGRLNNHKTNEHTQTQQLFVEHTNSAPGEE